MNINENSKKCRVCLKNNDITDSTCFIDYFSQLTGVKVLNNILLLCSWCKVILKRTILFIKFAKDTDKINLYDESLPRMPAHKNLYNLSYAHNSHIDLAPSNTKEEEYVNTENLIINSNDFIRPEVLESEATIVIEKSNQTNEESNQTNEESNQTNEERNQTNEESNQTNEESNQTNEERNQTNEEHNQINKESNQTNEESNQTCKNRKKLNYNELKFEMKHLNLEEQLYEIEVKKAKNSNTKIVCSLCGAGYLTKDLFEKHKLRHTKKSGAHKCNVCQLRFRSADVLSQHILSHKRQFRCLECDASFNRWSHCLIHRFKCGDIRTSTPCEYCLKIFSDEYSLYVHINGVHKKPKDYTCHQCAKRFASKQRLTVHTRSHSGLKPFSCAKCPRTFTTNSNLKAHSSVHSDVTAHYCVECDTYYKTAKSLKRHFTQSLKHNASGLTYLCEQCHRRLPTETALERHIKDRHNTVYRCSECNKTFSTNTNLNKHIKCIHTAKQ